MVTLSRPTASQQAPGSAVVRQPRNLDPAQHPFERAREYTRALNATKLERLFAAPFLAQIGDGHVDGVYAMAKDPGSLERFASGSGDGVVKVWDLTTQGEVWDTQAHENIVKDVCWTPDRKLLSCAADKTVKLFDPYNTSSDAPPLATYLGQGAFTSLSHHRHLPSFAASSSSQIQIYDLSRPSSTASQTLNWPTSIDTITSIAFNQTETSILASTGIDRSVIMYDLRTSSPLHKLVLRLASNAIAWNPMEAFNFAVANEDHNAYIFDMRKMDRALNVLKDHVAAVMDVEFSPTGEELVTASVFSAKFTPDNKYILSGSDDGNIRLWRANASDRSGIKSARQRAKLEYDQALVQRYSHMPQIRRIKRQRHVPKPIKKAGEIKREELSAIKRRQENIRKHTKKDQLKPRQSERQKMILTSEQ
ncbi:WD40-repeat-containing domain protein [Aspergillus alliaceus]|uniref:WD40-repeat-containing domain protein n=1 Tax=Petromyces alliaceus TaxID=209559 RepID=A0A5N7C9T6_PETAA|nr:WD40-repeat-containing domain protein [Aspergillus alliaceus]